MTHELECRTVHTVMTDNPTVLIDSRKGRQDQRWSYDLMKLSPLNLYGVECSLYSGDAQITGNGPNGAILAGVEVKSLGSLLSGLASGKLQSQVLKMLDTYSYSFLLYYGPYKIDDDEKRTLLTPRGKGQWTPFTVGSRTFPFGYLQNALLELSVLGINSLHFNSVAMIAEWIGCTARWWSKPWSEHSLFKVLDKSQQKTDSVPSIAGGGLNVGIVPVLDKHTKLKMRVAGAFVDMGFNRCLAAANHFLSPQDMMNADEKDWLQVNGIGKVLAKSISESAKRKA